MRINRTRIALSKMTEIWIKAAKESFMAYVSDVTLDEYEFNRHSVKRKRKIYTNSVQVEAKLLQNLTVSEVKMAIQIISGLKQNNALWYFDFGNKKDRKYRAMLSLRKKEILFETNSNNIHIVNPWKIRKGLFETVIAATSNLIEKKEVLGPEHIKDLKVPDQVKINKFLTLTSN